MPEEKKESLLGKVENVFHHKKKEDEPTTTNTSSSSEHKKPHESEVDKFKDYMAEDKKLEEEGKEYGGLM
ncbi:hypothetical protein PRZ48_012466 [Zasmidium cellare]|uniref:Dehydrin n=1 Tax=Zasmidium cellare TaxID=395010 RepID=A0ABR0E4Z0_ZASCE|nr:hypothetical protein PRZ48_012466 [Zasmidium cellare]